MGWNATKRRCCNGTKCVDAAFFAKFPVRCCVVRCGAMGYLIPIHHQIRRYPDGQVKCAEWSGAVKPVHFIYPKSTRQTRYSRDTYIDDPDSRANAPLSGRSVEIDNKVVGSW